MGHEEEEDLSVKEVPEDVEVQGVEVVQEEGLVQGVAAQNVVVGVAQNVVGGVAPEEVDREEEE